MALSCIVSEMKQDNFSYPVLTTPGEKVANIFAIFFTTVQYSMAYHLNLDLNLNSGAFRLLAR